MKAKRILLLANEYTTILNFRMELIHALNADGHKVFVAIPDNENNIDISAAGCTIVAVFSLFLTYFNDMRLQVFEVKMLLMEVLLMMVIAGVMYAVYRVAYSRTKQIVGIGR